MAAMASFVMLPSDRHWFGRCRRAWDFGALERRALEPVTDGTWDRWAASPAVREALAVHYFPGMWLWPRAIVDPLVIAAAEREDVTAAERTMLEAFLAWAPGVDDFTPVRVEPDVDVAVPDPVIPDQDLSTETGAAVRYRERVPLIVLDDADNRSWLVVHHVVDDWSHPDSFALDERSLTAVWAWQTQELSPPMAGVVHDELRLDPPAFRRTRTPLTPDAAEAAAARLGRTAMAMLDAAVRPEPTFDWTHCGLCSFRAPCLAMEQREDVDAVLAARYRQRTPQPLQEGRLGGTTWSQGRGARPQRFDGE